MISDTLKRLQMDAMVASVGAVSGRKVAVFLSMNALPYFVKDTELRAPTEGNVGRLLERTGVPSFKQLFEQAVELGAATIYPFSMAMDVLTAKPEMLDAFLGELIGLTKILADDGSQVWTS